MWHFELISYKGTSPEKTINNWLWDNKIDTYPTILYTICADNKVGFIFYPKYKYGGN